MQEIIDILKKIGLENINWQTKYKKQIKKLVFCLENLNNNSILESDFGSDSIYQKNIFNLNGLLLSNIEKNNLLFLQILKSRHQNILKEINEILLIEEEPHLDIEIKKMQFLNLLDKSLSLVFIESNYFDDYLENKETSIINEVHGYIKSKIERNIDFYNYCLTEKVFQYNNEILQSFENKDDLMEVLIKHDSMTLFSLRYNIDKLKN